MNIHAVSVVFERIDCLEIIIKHEERKLSDPEIMENRRHYQKVNGQIKQLIKLRRLNRDIYDFLKGNH